MIRRIGALSKREGTAVKVFWDGIRLTVDHAEGRDRHGDGNPSIILHLIPPVYPQSRELMIVVAHHLCRHYG